MRALVGFRLLALALLPAASANSQLADAVTNPRLGDTAAIAEGRRFYRTRCVICHGKQGGRGPNLFATTLSDEQFLETAINGRKGTLMPAFGTRMSPDEVWAIHAYIRSTDHYE